MPESVPKGRLLAIARRDGQTFAVYTGPPTVGPVAVWEAFGPDWNRQEPDVYGELADALSD
ncbi:MAG: hypothetical protein U0746_03725 [Gemmataceae bacterium]